MDALEADRSRQRGGPLEDGAVLMKGELLGKQYSIAGTTPSANGLAANVLLPAMSSSGLHPVPGQAAPFHPKQVGVKIDNSLAPLSGPTFQVISV